MVMSPTFSFAEPRTIDRPEDCFFYHRMDIPGIGAVGDQWDLRPCVDDYLGRFDFRGKRVLDVGAAGGYLTFIMEERGAEVVSFDIADGAHWDIVPHVTMQPRLGELLLQQRAIDQKLKNAYWFTHRRMKSRARAYYGNIYDLPTELGPFDVALFGMVLTHLRDPFQALYSASRLVSGTIIITNQMCTDVDRPTAGFVPSAENLDPMSWWFFSQPCLEQMVGVLGFKVERTIESQPHCLVESRRGPKRCVSLVASASPARRACPSRRCRRLRHNEPSSSTPTG